MIIHDSGIDCYRHLDDDLFLKYIGNMLVLRGAHENSGLIIRLNEIIDKVRKNAKT